MNRAAAELNTVQSNVTARVRALELELGVLLFQRHARGVKITPAGRAYAPLFGTPYPGCLATPRPLQGMTAFRVVCWKSAPWKRLRRFGSVSARKLYKSLPKGPARSHDGNDLYLIEDVVECRLEGAFVAGPVDHPDLQQESVFREELVLVTPRSIRALEDLSSITELKTIVFRVGCSYRIRLDNLLSKAGILVAQPCEFGSIDAILGCVAAASEFTLLPKGYRCRGLAGRPGRGA